MTRIFISHSHSDEAIAFKLVNFLIAALKIEEEAILCTSNPDQGLSYSSNSITDQLKNQLQNSEALIILITADSLNSAWIPFEAGSFWTTDKPVIPILGTGLTQNDLPGPLKSFLSIAIATPDFADKLNSAINQLAERLQIEQRFTTRRNHALREFSQHLKDWKSKYSESNASQQQQIDELTKQLEVFKIASQQEKEQIEQSYQAQIQELQQSSQDQQQGELSEQLKESQEAHNKHIEEIQLAFQKEKEQIEQSYQAQIEELQRSYQDQQQLEQSFKSQIQQLEEQLEQERTSSKLIDRAKTAAIATGIAWGASRFYNNQNVEGEAIELRSANGVDYTQLRTLLEQQQWREADQETAKLMLQAADRDNTYLRKEDIENFPSSDLRTINQLWLHYSENQFGFSIQKEINENLGSSGEPEAEIWNQFCYAIGWKKEENWLDYSELTFDLNLAPQGHLPTTWMSLDAQNRMYFFFLISCNL